jgi:hypothetical protein
MFFERISGISRNRLNWIQAGERQSGATARAQSTLAPLSFTILPHFVF